MKKPSQQGCICVLSVAIVAGAFFICSSAAAMMQSSEMTVTIPFDFYLRFQRFPSGIYTVKHFPGALFQIWNRGGEFERVSTNVIINDLDHPLTRLVFNQYGDHYFLTEVYWSDGMARRLPKSSFELGLAKQIHAKRVVPDVPGISRLNSEPSTSIKPDIPARQLARSPVTESQQKTLGPDREWIEEIAFV
jgi:hypothetical protein